jgi:uncharacterized protein YndB with AHSA1/START domain
MIIMKGLPMETTPTTAVDPLDRIDRCIDIDASAEAVWDLVSRPGWWINDGTVDPEPQVETDGEDTVLTHPRHGVFRLRTLESRPPSYVSFRWIDPGTDAGTVVEFWVEPRDAGVTLRVVESGFSRLGKPREAWLLHREGNVEGWATELDAARAFVTGRRDT